MALRSLKNSLQHSYSLKRFQRTQTSHKTGQENHNKKTCPTTQPTPKHRMNHITRQENLLQLPQNETEDPNTTQHQAKKPKPQSTQHQTAPNDKSTRSPHPNRQEKLLRKEVIQPHLPVRLPCYDFTPITDPTFDDSSPKGLGHRLRVLPTFVV